jgi:CO/xanthine dehydrogenase FAD-binding subunit
MKPVNFNYERPRTIDEACELLASDSNARILAGGQSLIPMLSMRLSRPSLLIDISHIKDLSKLVATDTHIEIGAMVRQADAKKAKMIKENIPLLSKALHHVGHPPTRARGTIGGSIAHADPSAEIALVAVTLGAEITYQVDASDQMFDATEFFIGPMLTVAPPDGCLVKVGFPKASAICGTGFYEVAPRRSDYALASAAAQISFDPSGKAKTILVGVGSVGDFPERLKVDSLLKTDLDDDSIVTTVHTAISEIETVDDLHASASYRKRAAAHLAVKALQTARDEVNKVLPR